MERFVNCNKKLSLLAAAIAFACSSTTAETLSFNANVIESLGLSHEQAKSAIEQAIKPQGKIQTGVYLNGKYTGVKEIDFGHDGNPCLDKDLLQEFGVKPDSIVIVPDTICLDTSKVSTFSFNYERNKNALNISIPDFYLQDNSQFTNIQTGGFGTFLNYDLSGSRNSGRFSQTDSLTALMSWGANIQNVLLRTNFSYRNLQSSSGNGYSHYDLSSAYLETDMAESYRVRAGYMGVGNTLFGAGQITGFTMNNNAGFKDGDTTVTVSGIAPGYAQVEVYQQGRVIFSRPVPAGPFVFEAVPLYTAFADAEVVVRENNGGEQRFTLPKAAFNVSQQMASRFSLFAGQTDPSRGVGNVPVLGGEYRLPFYQYLQPFAGMMIAPRYTGIGAGVGANWIPFNATGDMNFSLTRSGKNGDIGEKFSANVSSQLANASPWLSFSWQSYGYRDLGESQQTLEKDYSYQNHNTRYAISAGVSKPFGSIGSGLSLSRYSFYNSPDRNTLGIFGSYNTRYYTLSANMAYGWLPGNSKEDNWTTTVNLRIPFNAFGKKGSFSSYLNNYQRNTIFGSRVDQNITDNLNIGAGIDRYNGTNNSTNHNVNAFWRTPYVNTSAYYSGSNNGSKNYSSSLSGALVSTGDNFIFSPAQIQDTFAVIDTGTTGYTSISTPTTKVITNYDGLAVTPQLHEGRVNSIDIITKTLSDGAYIKNPHQEITIKRGAVGKVDYRSDQERFYLIRLIAADKKIPYGAKVLDEKAELLGYTIDENILMLNQEQADRLAERTARISNIGNMGCYIEKHSFKPVFTNNMIDVPVICGEKDDSV